MKTIISASINKNLPLAGACQMRQKELGDQKAQDVGRYGTHCPRMWDDERGDKEEKQR